MQEILELERLGFAFTVNAGKLKYCHHGRDRPDDRAVSLLAVIKDDKEKAISFLLSRPQVSTQDPGWDISPDDSRLWIKVLTMAKEIDVDLLARLLYLRGTGCRLIADTKTGLRIVPIIDPTGQAGWTSQAVYNSEKWCLNPYRQKLMQLLKKLSIKEGEAIAIPL